MFLFFPRNGTLVLRSHCSGTQESDISTICSELAGNTFETQAEDIDKLTLRFLSRQHSKKFGGSLSERFINLVKFTQYFWIKYDS